MAKASQFLKLTDKRGYPVLGESYDSEHMDEIDLTGWNWGVEDPAAKPKDKAAGKNAAAGASQSANSSRGSAGSSKSASGAATAGTGEGDDKIKPTLFSLTKLTDKATIRLINAMDNGEVFPKAVISIEEQFVEDTTSGRMPFKLILEFTNVFFTKLSWSVSAGRAGLEFSEGWDFNYEEIWFTYDYRGAEKKGKIPAHFVKPADSSDGASSKSPPSKSEEQAKKDKEMEDWAKRNGWTKPGKK